MWKNKNLLLVIVGVVALIIGGGIGFFGGTKYQQSKTQTRFTQFANGGNFMGRTGMNGRFGTGGANAMAVRGEIISADTNSITVKMSDGSTKIVVLGSSTMIAKTTTGSTSDLTNGANVIVFGTTNSDGSVTAQNIQIGNSPFGLRGSSSPTPMAQ